MKIRCKLLAGGGVVLLLMGLYAAAGYGIAPGFLGDALIAERRNAASR